MKIEDFYAKDEPPMNKALNDVLAIEGGDDKIEIDLLSAWLRLGTERLARVGGRGKCRDMLRDLDAFIREARPTEPWKD